MTKNIFSLIAMFAVIGDAAAGIRVGNLSKNYAGTYKNTLGLQQQYNDYAMAYQQDVPVETDLPVPVANSDIAEKIKTGAENAPTDIATLEECAKIIPGAEMVWDKPTLGRGAGGPATCVAIVEMRAISGTGNTGHTVAARGKLAAGDVLNCNISEFPSSTYLPEMMDITFPADKGPTREDVIKVLNEEQKDKAGIKIAAATVVSAIAGNIVGKSEPGKDSLIGTNTEKLKTTAAGAAIGAALMTASTFSGKVAGDTILHAGVNAAAGGVVGNMSGYGDSVLRVEKCHDGGVETTCLWGRIQKTGDGIDEAKDGELYYDIQDRIVYRCPPANGAVAADCVQDSIWIIRSLKSEDTSAKTISLTDLENKNPMNLPASELSGFNTYVYDSVTRKVVQGTGSLYKVSDAKKRMGMPISAVIVGFPDSAFGVKSSDWSSWRQVNSTNIGAGKTYKLCLRGNDGNPTNCEDKDSNGDPLYKLSDFSPLSLDATDGDVVDFSNKARLGATVKGAGIGGAIGGFSGYQGAQKDVEDRLNQATREYNDSLEKFYCGSGTKFLNFYNDDVIIPAIKK